MSDMVCVYWTCTLHTASASNGFCKQIRVHRTLDYQLHILYICHAEDSCPDILIVFVILMVIYAWLGAPNLKLAGRSGVGRYLNDLGCGYGGLFSWPTVCAVVFVLLRAEESHSARTRLHAVLARVDIADIVVCAPLQPLLLSGTWLVGMVLQLWSRT